MGETGGGVAGVGSLASAGELPVPRSVQCFWQVDQGPTEGINEPINLLGVRRIARDASHFEE